MFWFLYIIKCSNNKFYTGVSNDVIKRFNDHARQRGSQFTKINGVAELSYFEKFETKAEALQREKQIKNGLELRNWRSYLAIWLF